MSLQEIQEQIFSTAYILSDLSLSPAEVAAYKARYERLIALRSAILHAF